MKNPNVDLILEGGGFRCSFTGGIIDYFLSQSISFNNIYGVSAGSIVGALYKSRQAGIIDKIREIDHNFKDNSEELIDLYSLFHYIDKNYISFDFESFKESEEELIIVILNAESGQAEYINSRDIESKDILFKYIAASCAVPGSIKHMEIGGNVYYDGGFSDPIPVFKSWQDNKNKKLVVLTQDRSYRKSYEPVKQPLIDLLDHDKVLFSMENRYKIYNYSRDFAFYMENNNDALVFMPSEPVNIDFLKVDREAIAGLYKDGYSQAKEKIEKVCEILG